MCLEYFGLQAVLIVTLHRRILNNNYYIHNFPIAEYYERESIHDLSFSKRLHLGRYLVLAINFFRESISAFIDNRDPELRVKVWLRLLNILQLQKFLVKHFDSFPSLPTAYIGEKTISSSDGAGPSGLQGISYFQTKILLIS